MRTLALNRSFQPLAMIPWTRAVMLFYQGKVRIVEEYDQEVHSPSITMRVPAVVQFVVAVKPRRKAVKFSRDNIWNRDGGKCQYCREEVDRRHYTYDHVTPRAQGGRTVWDNVVASCYPCNQRKGNRTPGQAGMQLFKTPVRPKMLPNLDRIVYRDDMPAEWQAYLAVG